MPQPSPSPPQKSDEFQVIGSWLNDARSLIAAGKVQRWDVVKWTVTVNLALATASAVTQRSPPLFFAFALMIATIGAALVWHYNSRMTRARHRLTRLNAYVLDNIFDVSSVTEVTEERAKRFSYDRQELLLFCLAILLSLAPTLAVWIIGEPT